MWYGHHHQGVTLRYLVTFVFLLGSKYPPALYWIIIFSVRIWLKNKFLFSPFIKINDFWRNFFLGTRDDFGLGADPRLEGFPTYSMMHNDVTGKFSNKFSISTGHINDVIIEQQVQNTRQVCSQFCLIKFDFCQN